MITNRGGGGAYESTRFPRNIGPVPRLVIAPARHSKDSPRRLQTWGIDRASQRSHRTDLQILTRAQTWKPAQVGANVLCVAYPSFHSVEDWCA